MEYRLLDNIQEAVAWRMEVLEAVFGPMTERLREKLRSANESFISRNLGSDLIMIIIREGDAEIGCGAYCFQSELPSPDNPSGRCAYLMNIYVRRCYRHHGVGGFIVRMLVALARNRGIGKIYLETTEQARNLYLKSGFSPLNDMMKL